MQPIAKNNKPDSPAPDDPHQCWSEIGVFGDSSCPELRTYIHCHNCPVHSAAGLQLLNRALPDGYRRQRTEDFAHQRGPRDQANFSALLFRIEAEWLALPTHLFQEVTEPKRIHSLPHRRRGAVLGLANVRGELVACVALTLLLGIHQQNLAARMPTAYHRLLVIQTPDAGRFGCPVDEVHGPRRFHSQELKHSPVKGQSAAPSCSQAIVQWREQVVAVLDPGLLFNALQRSLR